MTTPLTNCPRCGLLAGRGYSYHFDWTTQGRCICRPEDFLTEAECDPWVSNCHYPGEEIEMEQTPDERIAALEARVTELESNLVALERGVETLETDKREREEAEERHAEFEDFTAEYRHRRKLHQERLEGERVD